MTSSLIGEVPPSSQEQQQRRRRRRRRQAARTNAAMISSSFLYFLSYSLLLLTTPLPSIPFLSSFTTFSSSSILQVQLLPTCHAFTVADIPDPVLHFSAGAVAGAFGAVAAYPFDYVKSQMQTEYGKERYGNGINCLADTLRTKPFFSLYKGVTVQILGIAPEKGIKLGVYDVMAGLFLTQLGLSNAGMPLPLWAQVTSGCVSGCGQVVASSPLEVLKVGLQTSDKNFQQVWEQIGGVRGLYRGAGVCVFRDVLFTGLFFPLYNYGITHDISTFIAGGGAGVIASFAATPADVVKTRIIAQDEWSLRNKQKQEEAAAAAADEAEYVEEDERGMFSSTLTSLSSMQEQREVGIATSAAAATAVLAMPYVATAAAVAVASNSTAAMTMMTPPPTTSSSTYEMYNSQSQQQQQQQNNDDDTIVVDKPNPLKIARSIIENEGPTVLFSGVLERCMGAIPRFGTTLAVHDVLEHAIDKAGWLSQTIVQ